MKGIVEECSVWLHEYYNNQSRFWIKNTFVFVISLPLKCSALDTFVIVEAQVWHLTLRAQNVAVGFGPSALNALK